MPPMWLPNKQNIILWTAGIILVAGISFTLVNNGYLLITGPPGKCSPWPACNDGTSDSPTGGASCDGVEGKLNTASCADFAARVLSKFSAYDKASCNPNSGADGNLKSVATSTAPYVCSLGCTAVSGCTPGGATGNITINPLL